MRETTSNEKFWCENHGCACEHKVHVVHCDYSFKIILIVSAGALVVC